MAGLLLLAGVLVWWLRRPSAVGTGKWQLPAELTPFSALGLLERIRDEGGLSEVQRLELAQSMGLLERHYFASGKGDGNGQLDLKDLAEGWLRKAK